MQTPDGTVFSRSQDDLVWMHRYWPDGVILVINAAFNRAQTTSSPAPVATT